MKLLLATFFLILQTTNSQVIKEYNFKSDNGFYGRFKMTEDFQPVIGSIIIEEFLTSEGLFIEKSLSEYGVVLPYECSECNFEIENRSKPGFYELIKVTNTQGNGFSKLRKAARLAIKNYYDYTALNEIISEIEKTENREKRLKIAYGSLEYFPNKKLLMDLVENIHFNKPIQKVATSLDVINPEPKLPIEVQLIYEQSDNQDLSQKTPSKISKVEEKTKKANENCDYTIKLFEQKVASAKKSGNPNEMNRYSAILKRVKEDCGLKD